MQNQSTLTFPMLGAHGHYGNQLFQIAALLAASEKHGYLVSFPVWEYQKYFKNQLPHIADLAGCAAVLNEHTPLGYVPIEPANDGRVYEVRGYRQNTKYFDHCFDKIREQFEFFPVYEKLVRADYPELEKETCISLHVRRGDYVNNPVLFPCDLDYYRKSIQCCNIARPTIIVCSDDIEWCRANLPSAIPDGATVLYSTYTDPIQDFLVLMSARHQIMANSSFSWWAAWLGRPSKGTVVAPKPWFRVHSGLCNDDIYEPGWTVLETGYGDC